MFNKPFKPSVQPQGYNKFNNGRKAIKTYCN